MTPSRSILRLGWAFHRAIFRLTRGRLGTRPAGDGLGTLFLLSKGRTSGATRRNALYYVNDGPNRVVVASNAGADTDPSWWRNLQATPETMIELGRERIAVRARQANHQEVGRLWPRLVAAFPAYAEYRTRLTRQIPIVILETR